MNSVAVFLDLDGTLLDTAPDLLAAINRIAREDGRAEVSLATLRPVVSLGGHRMVSHSFPNLLASEQIDILDRFLKYYREDIGRHTVLFQGLKALLELMRARDVGWGIVTDKPAWLTDPLLDSMALREIAHCVVSRDTVPERKPSPLPLLYAARVLDISPLHCVYVGDAERDILAGRAAGMTTVAALWGYIGEHDSIADWKADVYLRNSTDLLPWFETFLKTHSAS